MVLNSPLNFSLETLAINVFNRNLFIFFLIEGINRLTLEIKIIKGELLI